MLSGHSIHTCNICKRTTSCHAIVKGTRRISLLQDIARCRLDEVLASDKNSITYICRPCAASIRNCAHIIRQKLDRDNSANNPTVVSCKCHICKNANEASYRYRTDFNSTMRLVLFKLTRRYRSKGPGVVYFCNTCYRLFTEMTALLYKFLGRRCSKV